MLNNWLSLWMLLTSLLLLPQGLSAQLVGAKVELEDPELRLYHKETGVLWALLQGRSLTFTTGQIIEIQDATLTLYDRKPASDDATEKLRAYASASIERATFDTETRLLTSPAPITLKLMAKIFDTDAKDASADEGSPETTIEANSAIIRFETPADAKSVRRILVEDAKTVTLTSSAMKVEAPALTAVIEVAREASADSPATPTRINADCAASTRFFLDSLPLGDGAAFLGLDQQAPLNIQSIAVSQLTIVEEESFAVKFLGGALAYLADESQAFLQSGGLELAGELGTNTNTPAGLRMIHAFNRVFLSRPQLGLRCYELTYRADREEGSTCTLAGPVELEFRQVEGALHRLNSGQIRVGGQIHIAVKAGSATQRRVVMHGDGGFRLTALLEAQAVIKMRGDTMHVESTLKDSVNGDPDPDLLHQLMLGLDYLSLRGRGRAPLLTIEREGHRQLTVRGEQLRSVRDASSDSLRTDIAGATVQVVVESGKELGKSQPSLDFACETSARFEVSPYSGLLAGKSRVGVLSGSFRVQSHANSKVELLGLSEQIPDAILSGTQCDASISFLTSEAGKTKYQHAQLFFNGTPKSPATGILPDTEFESERIHLEVSEQSVQLRFDGAGSASTRNDSVIAGLNRPATLAALDPNLRSTWKADLATAEWERNFLLNFRRNGKLLDLTNIRSDGPMTQMAWLTDVRSQENVPSWAADGGWEWLGFESATLIGRTMASDLNAELLEDGTWRIRTTGEFDVELPLSGVHFRAGDVTSLIGSERSDTTFGKGLLYEEARSDGPLRTMLGDEFEEDGFVDRYEGPLRVELEGPVTLSATADTVAIKNHAGLSAFAARDARGSQADTLTGQGLTLNLSKATGPTDGTSAPRWELTTALIERDVTLKYDNRQFEFTSARYDPSTRRMSFTSTALGNTSEDVARLEGASEIEMVPPQQGKRVPLIRIKGRVVKLTIGIKSPTPTTPTKPASDQDQ